MTGAKSVFPSVTHIRVFSTVNKAKGMNLLGQTGNSFLSIKIMLHLYLLSKCYLSRSMHVVMTIITLFETVLDVFR